MTTVFGLIEPAMVARSLLLVAGMAVLVVLRRTQSQWLGGAGVALLMAMVCDDAAAGVGVRPVWAAPGSAHQVR